MPRAASPELDSWLERLDRTAALYAEEARSFTCRETIRWTKKEESGRRRYGYVVSLDDDGRLVDYRTRLKTGKKGPRRAEPGDDGVPAYLRSAYLWTLIFKRDRHPYHRYEIVGEENVFGREAVAIRFKPIPPFRPAINNWFGTAWVDRETAQLLKVTAHRPEDEEQLEKMKLHESGDAVADWVYVVEEVTTEFTVIERGMRFPGRVELLQLNYDFLRGLEAWKTQARTVLQVFQVYSDYQFFAVDTTATVEGSDTDDP